MTLFCTYFSAVFVPGYDVKTTYTSLFGLYECVDRFRDHVTVHLVYPLSHPPIENSLGPIIQQALDHLGSCDEFIAKINSHDLAGKNSWNYANVKVCYDFKL